MYKLHVIVLIAGFEKNKITAATQFTSELWIAFSNSKTWIRLSSMMVAWRMISEAWFSQYGWFYCEHSQYKQNTWTEFRRRLNLTCFNTSVMMTWAPHSVIHHPINSMSVLMLWSKGDIRWPSDHAGMAELVDALDLKSRDHNDRGGSSPPLRTTYQ